MTGPVWSRRSLLNWSNISVTKKYLTIHGDTIDGILFRELSRNDDEIESAFWSANPTAALLTTDGVHFPAGVVLLLPDVSGVRSVEVVSPWD